MRRTVVIASVVLLLGAAASASNLTDKAISHWMKQLTKSRDARERAEAAHSLGQLRVSEAAAPLGRALGDQNSRVRVAAAKALWALGEQARPAEADLWKALDDGDPAVVVNSAGALQVLDVEPARLADARRRALAIGNLSVRFLAVRGLIGLDPPAALLPHVLDYLDRQAERRHDMRVSAKGRSAADHNFKLADKALSKLVATGDRTLIPPLVRRVARDHPAQPTVLKALATIQPEPDGWDELLATCMQSSEAGTRAAAAELAFKRTAPEQTARWVPAVTRLLPDPDSSVRTWALYAVGAAGGLAAEATPVLVERLKTEPEARIRAQVAETLGAVGDRSQPVSQEVKEQVARQARPALERTVELDSDVDVRKSALASLDRLALDAPVIVAILARTAHQSREEKLTWAALQRLRNRGREAAPALDTIRGLRNSPNAKIAGYATTIAGELERELEQRPVAAASAGGSAAGAPATTGKAGPEPATEARGLATLRARGARFDEHSFFLALMTADPELVEAYLDAGMAADHPFSTGGGRQPLHILFFGRKACNPSVRPTAPAASRIVAALLAHGAGVNATDENGNTPLMFAGDKCDPAVIRQLIKAGARYDLRNGSGLTALEMGIWSGNDGLEALIEAGARLDAKTAAAYEEAYKSMPRALALVRKARRK
ncbi:MAG: HEAT repeat domain-containing protein [Acidobacteria bacterium]|nr:HEAT repeat domain-containing protein [Acidobacteriota bacterium]